MKDYLRNGNEETRGYTGFLQQKVEKSRTSIAAGRGYTNDEVEARMQRRFEESEQRKREGDA